MMNRIAVNRHDGKKLVGDPKDCRSVQLTLKDRIVYSIDEENYTVYVLRGQTYYE